MFFKQDDHYFVFSQHCSILKYCYFITNNNNILLEMWKTIDYVSKMDLVPFNYMILVFDNQHNFMDQRVC
jgi:hypothetical protein